MKKILRIFLWLVGLSLPLSAKIDIKAMLNGMGTTFGAPPVGFTYSFQVWNDANVPIHVEQEGIASFMGAYFASAKGYYGKQTLPSIFDANGVVSQAIYQNEKYYFNFYISEHADAHAKPLYQQELTQLPLAKNDPNVYYYHVYTAPGFDKGKTVHSSAVESMGYQNPNELNNSDPVKKGNVVLSSQLSTIVFENSSGTDVQITLAYGSGPYTFTAEKYSFNSLSVPTPQAPASSSTTGVTKSEKSGQDTTNLPPPFSLRPNTITFASASGGSGAFTPFKTLQLPSQGFDGSTYTIEIYQDTDKQLNVGIQGLNPGNYDMPITSRTRDVTPCPCTFWYQSAEQAGAVAGYSDLQGQVWVFYQGADSPVISKVTPGQVVSWNLTRPLVSQSDQFVYFVYVATTDDAQAAQFVTSIAQQQLGQSIIAQYQTAANTAFVMPTAAQAAAGLDVTGAVVPVTQTLTSTQQVAVLMGSLSIANGAIVDTKSGMTGYIVGTDIFSPCGLGFGRFYYQLPPSIISFSTLVSTLSAMMDSTKSASLGADLTSALTSQVNSWFTAYLQSPTTAQTAVQKFLIQYGSSQLVKGTVLTAAGSAALKNIMSGNVSLQYPSMKLSTVTNQYVFDFGKAAPDKMPTMITPLPQSQAQSSVPAQASASAQASPAPSKKVVPKSTLMQPSSVNTMADKKKV